MQSLFAAFGLLSVFAFLGLATIGLRRLGAGEIGYWMILVVIIGAIFATLASALLS